MAQTIPFQNDSYISRSWKMLTRDKGWIKPVLLLALGVFVPIVGPLVVLGYTYEWARITAWGIESAPKQRDVRLGDCLRSGWRAFVVIFVWGFLAGLLIGVVSGLLRLVFLGGVVAIVSPIVTIAASTAGVVAALRATIFQSFSAGFQFNRIYEMIKHDPKGLGKIILMQFLIGAGIGLAFSLLTVPLVLLSLPLFEDFAYQIGYLSSAHSDAATIEAVFSMMGALLRGLLPTMIVLGVLGAIVSTVLNLVVTNAVGLWMLQFNVPQWGASEDPLPEPLQPIDPYMMAVARPQQTQAPQTPGTAATPQAAPTQYYQPAPTQSYEEPITQLNAAPTQTPAAGEQGVPAANVQTVGDESLTSVEPLFGETNEATAGASVAEAPAPEAGRAQVGTVSIEPVVPTTPTTPTTPTDTPAPTAADTSFNPVTIGPNIAKTKTNRTITIRYDGNLVTRRVWVTEDGLEVIQVAGNITSFNEADVVDSSFD